MSPKTMRWLFFLLGTTFIFAAGLWFLWMYASVALSSYAPARKDTVIAITVGLALAFTGIGLFIAGLRFPLGSK